MLRPRSAKPAELWLVIVDASASTRRHGALSKAKGLLSEVFEQARRQRARLALLHATGRQAQWLWQGQKASQALQQWLAELGAAHPLVLETFKEASDALGYDLWALTQEGPADKLNQTDITQPAILAASIALWRLWLAEGGKRPDFVAGHSLGEYSALVAAECLTLAEAVKLVERRGQLMHT